MPDSENQPPENTPSPAPPPVEIQPQNVVPPPPDDPGYMIVTETDKSQSKGGRIAE